MSRLTIMPIFAHPDDESFAGTGSLIKYIREGVRGADAAVPRPAGMMHDLFAGVR